MEKSLKVLMLERGAELNHIGYIVKDLEKTIQHFSNFPGFQGEWDIHRTAHTEEMIKVGDAPYEFYYANIDLFGTPLEVIQPVAENSKGSYFDQYLSAHEEGMHHIAYRFPNADDYAQVIDKCVPSLVSEGYRVVSHAAGAQWPGTAEEILFEYCYLSAPASNLFFEVFWAEAVGNV